MGRIFELNFSRYSQTDFAERMFNSLLNFFREFLHQTYKPISANFVAKNVGTYLERKRKEKKN